jgi:acyl-CoA synthetase (AMP-forming)/AMP-acid ligase II
MTSLRAWRVSPPDGHAHATLALAATLGNIPGPIFDPADECPPMSNRFRLTRGLQEEAHYDGRRMQCFAERPANLDALFRASLARVPDAEAIVDGDTRITYAELDARVDRLAAGLQAHGIVRGDRVAFALVNRAEFVELVLACARIGAISVPFNVRMRRPEFEFALNQCGASLFVHEAEHADQAPDPADVPSLTGKFVCGGPAAGAGPYAALTADAPPALPDIAEEDTATILYTSGTTGRPKGAMLTHLGLMHSCLHFEQCMELQKGERSVLAVPASHVTGLVAIIDMMLLAGGCIVMMREFKARAFLELAERERCTMTVLVPAMYNLCLLDPEFDRFDLSAWRIGAYGGAPMPEATIAQLADKLPQLILVNAYGATETTSPTTIMPLGDTPDHPDSVGQCVPTGRIRIVGEDGRDMAAGEQGEIWVAGPHVVPGYWDNAEANASAFENGFWKSGDIGSVDAEGYVRVFDRKKDMINRAGFKIYSAEVENVMAHHPDIVEIAIVGKPDPVLGERVHAFVVRKGDTLDEAALKAWAAERLSDYKVPDSVSWVDGALPRNANGKVIKPELRDMLPKA